MDSIKRKYLIAFIVALVFSVYIPEGYSFGNFFSPTERKAMLQGKIVSRTTVYGKTIVSGGKKVSVRPPSCRFLPEDIAKYEILAEERAFFPLPPARDHRKCLYDAMVSFEKMKGMKYYSTGSGKPKTLILDSSLISDGTAGEKSKSDAKKKLTHFYRIKDNRFGWQSFKQNIFNAGNSFIAFSKSLQPMKRFGSTINYAGESLIVYVFHYDHRLKGYLYLGLHAMRMRNSYFRGLGLPSPTSMANRLRANTVYLAGLLGSDWSGKLKAFP